MTVTKILSFVMAVLTALSALFGMLIYTGKPSAPQDDFIPVLRFAATSDTHVTYQNDLACARIAAMMKSAYSIAYSDSDYNKLDAVIFAGDTTDRGQKAQFAAFASTVKGNLRDDTQFLACIAKAHDCSTLGKQALAYYSSITGNDTDFHKVINSFHFIGLSTSPDESKHYSDEQLAWLDEQLAVADAEAPGKPIFVFQHEHIKDTVFGSYDEDGWGVDYFTDILSKYPQVIDISGHSHYPANDPRAVWQGNFTAINDGGLAYYEFTVDGENSYHPADSKLMAQTLIVEVDADNRVLVRVYDVTAKQFIYEYLIQEPSNPDSFEFTTQKRLAAAKAPVFASPDCINSIGGGGMYTFSVPKAVCAEDDIIYLYRMKITDDNGMTVNSQTVLSGYYLASPPDTIRFDTVKLGKGRYIVEITAEDAWGLQSEPLTTVIDR